MFRLDREAEPDLHRTAPPGALPFKAHLFFGPWCLDARYHIIALQAGGQFTRTVALLRDGAPTVPRTAVSICITDALLQRHWARL